LEQFPAQELAVRPPDESKTTLVSRKPARRSISARDFRMPKPYRRPASAEARRGMSRLRLAMVAFSGLLIASLIAALALIAHENATSPHPLAVVAAKREQAPVPAAVSRSGAGRAGAPPAPAISRQSADAPLAPSPAELPPVLADLPLTPPGALPDDPDVVLIAAILMLTPTPPAPLPVCATMPADTCGATMSPDP
jgi:hypothetical protein